MVKYSVKKPITIFVCVLVILIFGVVSFLKMTPDLLPNMDFPYIVIVTSYPGAAPEEVEKEVSRPIEQSLSTLENLKSIDSSSAENVSYVTLQFEDGTDMNAIMTDVLTGMDMVENSWGESVGTPYILKLNPSMIPVAVTAVSYNGKGSDELSEFLDDTLENELLGTSGIASVNVAGNIKNSLEVNISEKKIEELSSKIVAALNGTLAEASSELISAQNKINSGKAQLSSSKEELSKKQDETLEELSKNSAQLSEAVAMSQSYNAQLSALNAQISALEAEKKVYSEVVKNADSSIAAVKNGVAEIDGQLAAINALLSSGIPESTPISAVITDEALLGELSQNGVNTVGDLKKFKTTLESKREELAGTLNELTEKSEQAKNRISEIDAALNNMATQKKALEAIVKKIDSEVGAAKEAGEALDVAKLKAAISFSSAAAGIESAESSLQNAQSELDNAKKTYESEAAGALEKANLSKMLTVKNICGIISAQDFDMPAGYAYDGGLSYIVSVGDGIEGISQLKELVLFDTGIEGVSPVKLKDVADIKTADNSSSVYARLNGSPAVLMTFMKQSSYATAAASDNLNDKFKELSEKYEGLSFISLMDQGEYIYMLTDSIIQSLLLGALFAVIVLFIFLKDVRPTLITLLSIPVSVLFAIVMMYFSGVSINIMSLAGLAISVGMLVDNSVVVIENTYRLRMLGESKIKAAVSGASQVAGAITSSTLTTICVFLPVIFVGGITKQLFLDLALTMTYSLLASLIIALTLVPAMSGLMLNSIKPKKDILLSKIIPGYKKAIGWALKHKAAVILTSAALLIVCGGAVLLKGFTFLTGTGSTQLSVSLTMPEDADFEKKAEISDEAVRRIMNVEGVKTVGAMMSDGGSIMMMSTQGDVSLYVELEDGQLKNAPDITKKIEETCSDLDCEVSAADSSMMGSYSEALSGSGVEIYVYGNDSKELKDAADSLKDMLLGVDGIASADNGVEKTSPELHITVDKEAAAKHNLTVAQVYQKVAEAINITSASISVEDGGRTYAVNVNGMDKADVTRSYLEELSFDVEGKDGGTSAVYLKDIAKIDEAQTLSKITRTDQRTYLKVTGALKEGYNVTLVANDVKAALRGASLPEGISYEMKGENETIMSTLKDLAIMLVLGLIMVYLVMVAQFQSLKSPFIIMFTIPLAFTGGFMALLLCGMEIGLMSMLGMIMLTGIIVNNGIVLVDYINNLRLQGKDKKEAIIEACVTRLRPILMTSVTTILGLLVIALGLDESSAIMQPLAVSCMGGLIYATVMTLFVVPVIYDAFNKKQLRKIKDEELIVSKK